jgi:hypothetical protein
MRSICLAHLIILNLSNLMAVMYGDKIFENTVEHQLSGLIGTTSHRDMQKIRIIGFFFENRIHWQFKKKKKGSKTAVLGYIFMYINKTLIHNSLYVFDCWGEKF